MIKNERQHRITKKQVVRFDQALERLAEERQPAVHPALHEAQVNALNSQRADLDAEVTEYERLRAGSDRRFDLDSFDQIAQALIKARIASGLTQRDLADRLGLNERQIQRYEATDYTSTSLARVSEVIDALNLQVRKPSSSPDQIALPIPHRTIKRLQPSGRPSIPS